MEASPWCPRGGGTRQCAGGDQNLRQPLSQPAADSSPSQGSLFGRPMAAPTGVVRRGRCPHRPVPRSGLRPTGGCGHPPLQVRCVGVDVLIDPCRVSGLRPTGGCGHPPLQVRCVGVDVLIDPCRVSGLRPTGGCGHPPLQVRCVGVDVLIDPCRVSGC